MSYHNHKNASKESCQVLTGFAPAGGNIVAIIVIVVVIVKIDVWPAEQGRGHGRMFKARVHPTSHSVHLLWNREVMISHETTSSNKDSILTLSCDCTQESLNN